MSELCHKTELNTKKLIKVFNADADTGKVAHRSPFCLSQVRQKILWKMYLAYLSIVTYRAQPEYVTKFYDDDIIKAI